MSYDIELFRLKEGKTIDDLNAFLKSDAYEEYMEKLDEIEENDGNAENEGEEEEEEFASFPPGFIDTSLSNEELIDILSPAFIKVFFPEETRSEEINKYLETGDKDDMPPEVEEELEMMFEYTGSAGVQPLLFSYGGNLQDTLGKVALVLKELQSQRIVAFDPQCELVVDGETAVEIFQKSVSNATDNFMDIIKRIESGELFDPDDEDEEDDSEDDEKTR